MADEPVSTDPKATIDSWTSKYIIISLGIALVVCMVAMLVPPFFGINLPSVMGERLYNLANGIVTGMFALFYPLAAKK